MSNFLDDLCKGNFMGLTLGSKEKEFLSILGDPFTVNNTIIDEEKFNDYYIVEPQFIKTVKGEWNCDALIVGTNKIRQPPKGDKVSSLIAELRNYYSEEISFFKWKQVKRILLLRGIKYVKKVEVPRGQNKYIYLIDDKLIYVTTNFKNNFYSGKNIFKKIPFIEDNWIVTGFYIRDIDQKLVEKFNLK